MIVSAIFIMIFAHAYVPHVSQCLIQSLIKIASLQSIWGTHCTTVQPRQIRGLKIVRNITEMRWREKERKNGVYIGQSFQTWIKYFLQKRMFFDQV